MKNKIESLNEHENANLFEEEIAEAEIVHSDLEKFTTDDGGSASAAGTLKTYIYNDVGEPILDQSGSPLKAFNGSASLHK